MHAFSAFRNVALQCLWDAPLQASNGCVSHAYLVKALRACHAKRACIFDANVEATISSVSVAIRTHLSKYRDTARAPATMKVVRSKAIAYSSGTLNHLTCLFFLEFMSSASSFIWLLVHKSLPR